MSDPHTPSRNLSEIGHLFLSSVRERQTGGTLPKRQPPGVRVAPASPASSASQPQEPTLSVPAAPRIEGGAIELTAEEIEGVRMEPARAAGPVAAIGHSAKDLRVPPITAIVGAHLNGKQIDRVKEYARHAAAGGQRIGLIEVDASEFRVSCFDRAPHGVAGDHQDPLSSEDHFDAREMGSALEELSWDLDRWLVVLPNLRSSEARGLLRDIGSLVVLSTCDHDGVVGCYRTLKGLHADIGPRARLSLALLDARHEDEADRVYRKLARVCGQFLGWPLEAEPSVRRAVGVAEHLVMCGPPATLVKGQLPPGAQWQVVTALVARANSAAQAAEEAPNQPDTDTEESESMARVKTVAAAAESDGLDRTAEAVAAEPRPMAFGPMEPVMRVAVDTDDSQDPVATVIDLPETGAGPTAGSVLAAILRSESAELVECPVRPPMCPEARLAVTRDRRIVLLGAARQGLGELRAIGRAYHWLVENQNLICMAMPQLAIDPMARPCLRLLVDHADLTADLLQPMLQSGTVTVQAYRRVRWGGKMGLMLDAA